MFGEEEEEAAAVLGGGGIVAARERASTSVAVGVCWESTEGRRTTRLTSLAMGEVGADSVLWPGRANCRTLRSMSSTGESNSPNIAGRVVELDDVTARGTKDSSREGTVRLVSAALLEGKLDRGTQGEGADRAEDAADPVLCVRLGTGEWDCGGGVAGLGLMHRSGWACTKLRKL